MGERGVVSRLGRRRARMKGPRSHERPSLTCYKACKTECSRLFFFSDITNITDSADFHFFFFMVLRGANFFQALNILIIETALSSKSSYKHEFSPYFELII